MSGFFGIGIAYGKHSDNLGTLWRGAYQLGASFIFTIGNRYKPQSSDVFNTWASVPLRNYPDTDTMWSGLPYNCPVVAIEMGGEPLETFVHPRRCVYLLGAEDHGLGQSTIKRAPYTISLPHVRDRASFNVAQAGTIVMYDRLIKMRQQTD